MDAEGQTGGDGAESRAEAARLERVRRLRVRPEAATDISRLFLVQVPEMRRLRRQLGPIAEAWAGTVPEGLAARARLEGVSRGVLNVRAADAAAVYELDRFLRSGGEATLLRAMPVAVRRVRVSVDGAGG